MTTDSAGIVERFRAAIRLTRLPIATKALCDEAAAHIEAQAVELERMADLVRRAQQNTPDHYVNWHEEARAALGAKP